tara:strand:+ start:389 stop:517 length:129 start_codon:yes stop_codon:yes gene_type:complete
VVGSVAGADGVYGLALGDATVVIVVTVDALTAEDDLLSAGVS